MRSFFVASEVEIFPEPLKGLVERPIARSSPGRVKFLATYWPARFYQSDCQVTLSPGEPVDIIGIQGITLLVLPIA